MTRYDRGYGPPHGWQGDRGPGRGRMRGLPDGPALGPWDRPVGGGYGGAGGRGWRHGPDGSPRGGPGWGGAQGGYRGGPGQGMDRGAYGGAYEEFGGYPGGRTRGEYYGGPGEGRFARGYDAGFASAPFVPDEAYRRHPEYRQTRQPREWEAYQGADEGYELSDDEVRDAVYRRMSVDAWVDADRIEVQVDDGVVTLSGEVDDFMEARYAWDDAWEAEGVRGVVNNLTVRADLPHETHGDVVVQGAGDRATEEDQATA
jgi:hypothetical protein